MKTADFDYELPPELIAQEPACERTAARMLVVHRTDGAFEHRHVRELPHLLRTGDLLVINDTRVIAARLLGRKEASGGKVELLLLEELSPDVWVALCRSSRRPQPGAALALAGGKLRAVVRAAGPGARVTVALSGAPDARAVIAAEGFTPLPPYIRRRAVADAGAEGRSGIASPELRALLERDRERYQTVYARAPGAVAAPTAGLHFTARLLQDLEAQGIGHVAVTLHVGLGTFKPVEAENVEAHRMEAERYEITEPAAERIARARAAGGRIVAVGSTTVRTLETAADAQGHVRAGAGRSELFIYPPYRFRAVDAMLTNFHLPRSTLLMMVSALAGTELIRQAYREAVRERYRFYSYGDCMLIV